MPTRRAPATPPPCVDSSKVVMSALRKLRTEPNPATARVLVGLFATRCPTCDRPAHVDDDTYLDWLAARLDDGPIGSALQTAMFGSH